MNYDSIFIKALMLRCLLLMPNASYSSIKEFIFKFFKCNKDDVTIGTEVISAYLDLKQRRCFYYDNDEADKELLPNSIGKAHYATIFAQLNEVEKHIINDIMFYSTDEPKDEDVLTDLEQSKICFVQCAILSALKALGTCSYTEILSHLMYKMDFTLFETIANDKSDCLFMLMFFGQVTTEGKKITITQSGLDYLEEDISLLRPEHRKIIDTI